MSKNNSIQSVLMTLAGLLLLVVFFPLASAPMAVVLRLKGPKFFVINQLAIAALLVSLGHLYISLIWLSLSVLVFFLREALRKSHSKFDSGSYAVLSALLVFSSLFAAYNGSKLFEVLSGLKEKALAFIGASPALTDFIKTNNIQVDSLLGQSPSLLVILFICAVTFALLFGRGAGRDALEGPDNLKLNTFKVPNAFIFILLFSIAGTFLNRFEEVTGLSVIAANLLNICGVVYALQGVAIVSRFFELNRVTLFWRIFAFFILLVQLPVLLTGLGFMDYWINFRARFEQKLAAAEEWRKQ